jgi:hypothetical protein
MNSAIHVLSTNEQNGFAECWDWYAAFEVVVWVGIEMTLV